MKPLFIMRYLNSILIFVFLVQGCQSVNSKDSMRTTTNALNGKLVFVDESQNAVCLANADGTQRRVLAENGRSPLWFPSGNKVAYITHWGQPEIAIVSLNGTVFKRFQCTGQLAGVKAVTDISSDGINLLLSKSFIGANKSGIYNLNIETGTISKILEPDDVASLIPNCKEINVSHGSLSPDGSEIAFTVNCWMNKSAIGIIKKDGTGLRLVTDFPLKGSQWGGFSNRGWSPNGKQILAVNFDVPSSDEKRAPPYGTHIFVIDVNKKSIWQIPADDKYERSDPCWSPDGSKIVYSEKRVYTESNVDICLVVINADGTNPQRIFSRNQLSIIPYVGVQNYTEPRWWASQ